MVLYSAKRWRRKTLANQQNIALAKKNFGKSSTWKIKQKFRPPDASGRPKVKLWQISANRGANIEKTKPRLPLQCKEQCQRGSLRPRHDSLDCFTSALANSIALAITLSLSGPSGSGRVGVLEDDNDPNGLKHFKIHSTTRGHIRTVNLTLY